MTELQDTTDCSARLPHGTHASRSRAGLLPAAKSRALVWAGILLWVLALGVSPSAQADDEAGETDTAPPVARPAGAPPVPVPAGPPSASPKGAPPVIVVDDKGHEKYKGFQVSGKYILTLNNVRVEDSAVWWSQVAQCWLITKEGAPRALVIERNTRNIGSTPSKNVLLRDDGNRFLRASAKFLDHGKFEPDGDSLKIGIEKKTYMLIPNPPLLGWLTRADLLTHTPEYGTDAKDYIPDPELVKRLTKAAKDRGETEISIYFGSWCTACSRVLGRILRVEEMLQADGLKVVFKYYGFPEGRRQYRRDTEWRNNDIKLLPTGVVRTGTTANRSDGLAGWTQPEKALLEMLGN